MRAGSNIPIEQAPSEVLALFDEFCHYSNANWKLSQQKTYAGWAAVLGAPLALGWFVFGNPEAGPLLGGIGAIAAVASLVWYLNYKRSETRRFESVWRVEQRAKKLGVQFVFVSPGESYIHKLEPEDI